MVAQQICSRAVRKLVKLTDALSLLLLCNKRGKLDIDMLKRHAWVGGGGGGGYSY